MKSTDAKASAYIDFDVESNDKDPKFNFWWSRKNTKK